MDTNVTDSDENSDLPSQELADRVAECVPANTRKTTEWAVATYKRWAQRRSNVRYVKEDLLAYRDDLQALDQSLYKFFSEVHTTGGPGFTPSSLQVLRAGLQRYMTEHDPDMPLMSTDPTFRRSNAAFKAAKRRYALDGTNRAANQMKQPLDPVDQELVRKYFATSKTYTNPTILQQYVYYMLSMTFGYRGREVWRQLRKDSFVEERDQHGKLRYVIDQAIMEKNYQHTGPNATCRRATQITDDVEAGVYMFSTLKLYLSKLHPEQDAFLQKAKNDGQMAAEPDAACWYVNAPLGKHTIDQLMPRISAAAGTSRRYTNHCVRHTLGTNMLRLGYPITAIQARLRLRSSMTLHWYTGHRTSEELEDETRAITRPLRGVAPPQPGAGDGAVAGPSSAPQYVAPPASGSEASKETSKEAPASVPASSRRDHPPQHVVPRTVTDTRAPCLPPGAGTECWDAPAGVVPLHQADVTRPPPPLPLWARGNATPKVYSGVFHNCVFH